MHKKNILTPVQFAISVKWRLILKGASCSIISEWLDWDGEDCFRMKSKRKESRKRKPEGLSLSNWKQWGQPTQWDGSIRSGCLLVSVEWNELAAGAKLLHHETSLLKKKGGRNSYLPARRLWSGVRIAKTKVHFSVIIRGKILGPKTVMFRYVT